MPDGIEGTTQQRAGIEQSKANIAANPENALIVELTYRHVTDDSGIPGREVTVFAVDGDVLDSQDFG